jgi:hypothetical protein
MSRADRKVKEAQEILRALGFEQRQCNAMAGYVLLTMLDLKPSSAWSAARNPALGIREIKDLIADRYKKQYAENTRETIRDEVVKHFVGMGMLIRNPDDPNRPTNSANTVYQVEPTALDLFRVFDTLDWPPMLRKYLANRTRIKGELDRHRQLARIPVTLPGGETVALSPGGQNPLIKQVIEQFCARFTPGGVVIYIGDTENKFQHLHAEYLAKLGVVVDSADKMPDVVVHDTKRNWLLLIEAVTSAGPVDGKRRKELKELFRNSTAGLVFVTAFENRKTMQSFLTQISWETEVWVAEAPDHLIHFNGERFLGPYPDVQPSQLGNKSNP